jgi:hypothetical protein
VKADNFGLRSTIQQEGFKLPDVQQELNPEMGIVVFIAHRGVMKTRGIVATEVYPNLLYNQFMLAESVWVNTG